MVTFLGPNLVPSFPCPLAENVQWFDKSLESNYQLFLAGGGRRELV